MKKNVSLGKQLQFVNLKMLVLTHLSFSSHLPPHPRPPLAAWAVGEGQGPAAQRRGCTLLLKLAWLAPQVSPGGPPERPALVPSECRAWPTKPQRSRLE